MRLPYLQLYVSDFLVDTQCLTAHQVGVWIRLLCHMSLADQRGVITKSPDEIARIAGCTVDELMAALVELSSVTGCVFEKTDGVLTVKSERMVRDDKARRMAANRKAWQRSNEDVTHDVTPMSRECHADVTVQSINRALTEQNINRTDRGLHKQVADAPKSTRQSFTPPKVEEVKAYMIERKWKDAPAMAEKFCDHYESRGWFIGKNKMRSWQAAVRTWEKNGVEQTGAQPPRPYSGKPKTKAVRICASCKQWADDCMCETNKRGNAWRTVEIPSEYDGDRALGAARELTERRA